MSFVHLDLMDFAVSKKGEISRDQDPGGWCNYAVNRSAIPKLDRASALGSKKSRGEAVLGDPDSPVHPPTKTPLLAFLLLTPLNLPSLLLPFPPIYFRY